MIANARQNQGEQHDCENNTGDNNGCPYLANKALWPGFNDLQTKYPEIAMQWHPTKNGDLTPDRVLAGSHSRAWWLLPYDDLYTGEHFAFIVPEHPGVFAAEIDRDIVDK